MWGTPLSNSITAGLSSSSSADPACPTRPRVSPNALVTPYDYCECVNVVYTGIRPAGDTAIPAGP